MLRCISLTSTNPLSPPAAVTLGFTDEELFVDEGQGTVSVQLSLSDVSAPTETQIWANIVSGDSSALGT
jgi:hypothetical protein